MYRRAYLEAVLDAASRADHLVVTGDVTNLALEGEFHEALRLFESRRGGAELTVIPGNHDLYLPRISREGRFEHHFGAFVRSDLPLRALRAILDHPEVAGRFPVILVHHPPVDSRNRAFQLRDGLTDAVYEIGDGGARIEAHVIDPDGVSFRRTAVAMRSSCR